MPEADSKINAILQQRQRFDATITRKLTEIWYAAARGSK
jgi:hypothetical protein